MKRFLNYTIIWLACEYIIFSVFSQNCNKGCAIWACAWVAFCWFFLVIVGVIEGEFKHKKNWCNATQRILKR